MFRMINAKIKTSGPVSKIILRQIIEVALC